MCFRELNRSMNKHRFKSLFSSLFRMKGDLISQNRRLALSELGGLKRGTLAVQASQTIASYWLPRRLVVFHQTYPGIELRVGIGNTAQVAKEVINGAAELGFIESAVG